MAQTPKAPKRSGFTYLATVPAGWRISFWTDRLGDVFVIAVCSNSSPKMVYCRDLPMPFHDWLKVD